MVVPSNQLLHLYDLNEDAIPYYEMLKSVGILYHHQKIENLVDLDKSR